MFRWYESDPQAFRESVRTSQDRNKDRGIQDRAKTLLWEEKRVTDLRAGERLKHDGHVLAIDHGPPIVVQTERGTNTNYSHNPTVAVYRAWCESRETGCVFCQFEPQ